MEKRFAVIYDFAVSSLMEIHATQQQSSGTRDEIPSFPIFLAKNKFRDANDESERAELSHLALLFIFVV